MKKYFKKVNKIIWQKRIRVFFLACLTFVSLGLISQLKQTQNSLNVSNSITIKKSNNQSQISQFKTGIGALPQYAMAASLDSDPPTIDPGNPIGTGIDPTTDAGGQIDPLDLLVKSLKIKKNKLWYWRNNYRW